MARRTIVPYRRNLSEQRRQDIFRVVDSGVDTTAMTGRVMVVGIGEFSVDVPFSVYFAQRPHFTFGAELDTESNQSATAGSFPSATAVVSAWDLRNIAVGFEGNYAGCTLAVVVYGKPDQNLWVHYTFTGKAFRNPLNSIEGPEDTI